MRKVVIALAAAALGTTAVADSPSVLGAPPASGTGLSEGQCLLSHEIGRHRIVDDRTVLLNGFGRSKGEYRVTMAKGCFSGAVSSDPISLVEKAGKICEPTDLQVGSPGTELEFAL